MNEAVVDVNPLPPMEKKMFDDVRPEHITELTKQYLATVAEKIRLLDAMMNRNSWLKYILLGTQFACQVGNVGAGIVSTVAVSTSPPTTSMYPVAGVFAFSLISSLGMFIQTKLNPEDKISKLQALQKRLEHIQIELQTVQITKSLERFKEAEANLDSIIPVLNF